MLMRHVALVSLLAATVACGSGGKKSGFGDNSGGASSGDPSPGGNNGGDPGPGLGASS